MAFITLEDLVGTVEVIIFPRDYEKYAEYLNEDSKIFVRGRASIEEDKEGKLICERITPFEEVTKKVWVKFDTMEQFQLREKELMEYLKFSEGRDQVIIYVAETKMKKPLPANQNVLANKELATRLNEAFGQENVKIV